MPRDFHWTIWMMRVLHNFKLPSKPSTTNTIRQYKPVAHLNMFLNKGLCWATGQKTVWPKKIILVNILH